MRRAYINHASPCSLCIVFILLHHRHSALFRVKFAGSMRRIIYAFVVNANSANGARISESVGQADILCDGIFFLVFIRFFFVFFSFLYSFCSLFSLLIMINTKSPDEFENLLLNLRERAGTNKIIINTRVQAADDFEFK